MALSNELIQEMTLLMQYDLSSTQTELKVHSGSASDEMISAAQRLYDKKIVDQKDGGYLTSLGREVAEHVQSACRILKT